MHFFQMKDPHNKKAQTAMIGLPSKQKAIN